MEKSLEYHKILLKPAAAQNQVRGRLPLMARKPVAIMKIAATAATA
jgi:hypothetical protein